MAGETALAKFPSHRRLRLVFVNVTYPMEAGLAKGGIDNVYYHHLSKGTETQPKAKGGKGL